jgi:hypothetical protein
MATTNPTSADQTSNRSRSRLTCNHVFDEEITETKFRCECGETRDIREHPEGASSASPSASPIDTGRAQTW